MLSGRDGQDSWCTAAALVHAHVLWPQHVRAAEQTTLGVKAAVERSEVCGADLDDGWQHALCVVLAKCAVDGCKLVWAGPRQHTKADVDLKERSEVRR